MKLVERYINHAIVSGISLVAVILVGLQLFILFIAQLNDIGHGNYTVGHALIYSVLMLPKQLTLFFPNICLLGTLLGLGNLAHSRELLIMRAGGLSIKQVIFAVLKPACILIIGISYIGEQVAPKMVLYAQNLKMQKMTRGQSLITAEGIWMREKNNFIYIQSISSNNTLDFVSEFHFNRQHHLILARKIRRAYKENDHWIAEGIQQTQIGKSRTQNTTIAQENWNISIDPIMLRFSSHDSETMTLSQLYHFLRQAQLNHQKIAKIEIELVQRVLQPFAILVMMLLAIPFIFGPLRSTTMGSKFLVGALIGFGFYILNRVFGMLGPILQISSFILAPIPLLIFMIIGFHLMRKVR